MCLCTFMFMPDSVSLRRLVIVKVAGRRIVGYSTLVFWLPAPTLPTLLDKENFSELLRPPEVMS